MKCAIICGGLGTRLGTHAGAVPKVLAPFGGRPLLDHLIEAGAEAGIRDFLLLTGHLSSLVKDHVEFCSVPGVRLEVVEEQQPLGTAGSIKAAEQKLAGDDFVVLYGDVMLSMDLGRMIDFHRRSGGWATLAVHPNDHPCDSDLLALDDADRVQAFYSKPRSGERYFANLVNAGAYVLAPEILSHIPSATKCDFGRHVFPALVSSGRVFGYRTAEYLKDIGTPARYDRVRRDFNSGLITRMHRRAPRPAIFLDRDGVLNREIGGVQSADQLELLPRTAEAVRRINRSGYLAVVITNQPVVAKGWTSAAELARIHDKLETLLGQEGAYLDAIYYCPHHPDGGYPGEIADLKIHCDCRKPAPGLLRRAARDLNIDLTASVFIGDSERDFLCARAADVRAVGVGQSQDFGAVPPELHFADLCGAVDALLHKVSGGVLAVSG